MNFFKILPGFVKTPAGLEREVLRRLPKALVFGTLLLCLPSLMARIPGWEASATEVTTRIDSYAIAVIIVHWTLILTLAIAAFIVLVMKGPAYVADAYPLEDAEHPDHPDRSDGRTTDAERTSTSQ